MNKIKSVLFAAGISLALAFTFGCSSSDDSGGISSNSLVVSVSSSSVSVPRNSSASESMMYCVYQEMSQCFETYQARCPSGGELSDFCPYGSSSSTVASSSSSMPSSSSSIPSSSSVANLSSTVSSSSSMPSSSSSSQYSSSSALLEYNYCIFDADKICLAGTLTACPPGGTLSNICSYDNSSSSVISSSIVSSSSSSSFISSSAISSSSSMPSSSSVASSSSFSITYTLICANVPTSATVGTAITPPTVTCNGSNSTSTIVSGGLNWTGAPTWNNPAAGTYNSVSVAASSGNCSGKTTNCGGTLIVADPAVTYTLTCASVPTSGTVGKAITAPTATCTSSDGTSELVSRCLWGNGPSWDNPKVGVYRDIDVLANSGNCVGKHATCGGTLTIQYDYGTPVTYEGETYQTVVIGTQTWLQRNLNYAVEGSKCYRNDDANCETYGRLYDWTTAMALHYSCNSWKCASSNLAYPKYRGICPEGWHIPSFRDWDNLLQYVNSSVYTLNSYGFSALLGGYGYGSASYGDHFSDVGFQGKWWSSSENGTELALNMNIMSTISAKITNSDFKRDNFYSVRCMMD